MDLVPIISRKGAHARDVFDVLRSGLFDRGYYEHSNPDVPRGRLASLKHFLLFGGREGRSPHPMFDSSFYLEKYPDVRGAGINPLIHFLRFGRAEHRYPNRKCRLFEFLTPAERRKFQPLVEPLERAKIQRGKETADIDLHSLFGTSQPERRMVRRFVADVFLSGTGIEVGALQDPLPTPPGATVRYVDRFSKVDLVKQYPELAGAPLVDVDIVDNGEELFSLPSASQDFVVANHFLEHTQDPIATLKNFCRVVRPGGYLYIAVPDQTSTFDRDREPTTLQHLIDDHAKGPAASRHSHFVEWVSLCEPHFGRSYSAAEVAARVAELEDKDYSIHYHCWRPSDFKDFLVHCSNNYEMKFEIPLFARCPGEMVVVLRVES
jgi:SAM-dependent methyltransferase